MNEVIPNLVGGLPGVNGIFQIKFPKISNLAVQFFFELGCLKMSFSGLAVQIFLSGLAVQKWIFRTWQSKNVFWAWRSKNGFFGLGGPKIIFPGLAVQK